MIGFAFDYYLMVVVAAGGVLQIAASIGKLDALLFFKSPIRARALGAALIVAGLALFFGTAHRNINDYDGGLDGNFQLILFLLGAITAIASTATATSFVNKDMNAPSRIEHGIQSLARTTYARALARNLLHMRNQWRKWTKAYFSG